MKTYLLKESGDPAFTVQAKNIEEAEDIASMYGAVVIKEVKEKK